VHRAATGVCVLLAVPGVLWWKNSILFVILLSLSTQAWTSWGSAEAADNRELREQLERMEAKLDALLKQRRPSD
jgi:hypothetical protein